MKKFLLLSFVLTFASILLPQSTLEFPNPVEDVKWGMSTIEFTDVRDDAKRINDTLYTEKIDDDDLGEEANVFFIFTQGKLNKISYFFKVNVDNYLEDFEEFENEKFEPKYGAKSITYDWGDDRLKNDPDEWNNAIKHGELIVYTQRDFNEGYILHTIGGTSKCLHLIGYVNSENQNSIK